MCVREIFKDENENTKKRAYESSHQSIVQNPLVRQSIQMPFRAHSRAYAAIVSQEPRCDGPARHKSC